MAKRVKHPEHKLIDAVPWIVWRADAQTLRFTSVGGYAEELLGYPVERWTSEQSFWQDRIYSEDRSIIAERANAIRNTGAYDLEYRMMAADGRPRWVRDIGRIVPDGGPGGKLAGIIVDLSRKRTQAGGLAKSKLWLRGIIDTIPQQIWSGPSDGTVDFCNDRWRSELGLGLNEIQGDGWQQILHPDDRDRVLSAWRESVLNGTPYERQERHRMADGEYRWFLARGVPLRDEQGRVIRWYGTNTDIEDQKRAEECLRRQEQRWRAVFDNAYVGVAILDASEHYVAVNSAYEKMLGYSFEELSRVTFLDVIHRDDRRTCQLHARELWDGKRDRFAIEERNLRKNGEVLWVRASGSILSEPSGEPRRLVMLVEDITERKRLDDELELERDRLRLLLDLTDQLIGKLGVSSVVEAVLAVLHQREQWALPAILLPESTDTLKVYRFGEGGSVLQDSETVPIEGTAVGRAYRSGQRIVFRSEEVLADAPWVQDVIREAGVVSGCILPLIHRGRVLGMMFLGAREIREFSATELTYVEENARLVAAALDTSLEFEALSTARERLANEKNYTDEQIRSVFDFEHIIGRSKAIQGVLQQVETVAPTDSAVLILGETGTGKELIARAIHDRSPRRDEALVKVDCAAIPAALLESELFGYEKGAFTGAVSQKLGRLETADRGTLFLDEIGDLPLELQAKLLRVLQDRAFERLGSNRTRHLDVRVIAATNRDLEEMVDKGEFRADLYYRLKVFPIVIPPLRSRPEDIPSLVWHYIHKYAQRPKKTIDTVPAEAMEAFRRYPWPGNVRELQHFIERSVILTPGNTLQAPIQSLRTAGRTRPAEAHQRTMEEIEREAILEALRKSNWVVGGPKGAARKLGMKRTTLASRMERLGISRRSAGERHRSGEDA